MVNASSAPAKIPGRIMGRMTFVSAWKGVAPRSIAALARLGSRLRTLGYTLVITKGVQKLIWAKSMVQ